MTSALVALAVIAAVQLAVIVWLVWVIVAGQRRLLDNQAFLVRAVKADGAVELDLLERTAKAKPVERPDPVPLPDGLSG